jgi:hypothetical protein
MCATSCGGKTPRSTRPRSILKTIHPLTSEPTSPTPHDLGHAVQPRRDLDVAQPIGGVEHKLGALHDLVRERVARRPTLELDTLLSAQDDLGRAASQVLVFVASGSVALLADLIHNFGDASTAIPLGVAFALRSARAERWAGLAVVLVIFASACVAGYEAVDRLIDPQEVEARGALAVAGALGFAGNWVAAIIRSPAGHRLGSPARTAPTRAPTPTAAWRWWRAPAPLPPVFRSLTRSSGWASRWSSCGSPGTPGARCARTCTEPPWIQCCRIRPNVIV